MLGGNGFLYWDFRDINYLGYPYLEQGMETLLGLVLVDDTIKPGLQYYVDFSRNITSLPYPTPSENAIGIYWPLHYYKRDDAKNPGNQPQRSSANMIITNYLLKTLGYNVQIVRGDLPMDPSLKTLIITSVLLTLPEVEKISAWVRAGGHLVWHSPSLSSWSKMTNDLIGAAPADFRAALPFNVVAFGATWTFTEFMEQSHVEYQTTTATVIAKDDKTGLPVIFRNIVGKGVVVTAAGALVEDTIVQVAQERVARDKWQQWYAGMLSLVST